MRSSASVAVEEAALVVGTAAAGGVAPRILLAAAGLDRARLEEPRLPQPAFDGLLQQAVRPSGDAAFGLHAAELTADGHRLPAPLRYGLAACATVGDQLAMAARYARLLHSDAEAALAVHGDLARVTYRLPASAALVRRHMGERWLGALLLLARREAGDGLAPREVAFAHPAPRDTSAHVHLFRAPLRFEQATDALVLGREVLDVRVRHGDAGLQRVLDGHLSTLLPAVRAAGLPELVQGRLRAAVPGRLPELEAVAAALTITPRTLQRRLAQEGTGFREPSAGSARTSRAST